MASTYLTRTPSSSGNRKTFTFSFWVKRGDIGTKSGNTNCMYSQHNSSNDYNSYIGFNSTDTFSFWDYTNAYTANLKTNAKYRDTFAWYNFVVAVDTTQATDTNRIKIYVNGVQITSLDNATYPSQNADLRVNEYQAQQIGVYRYGSTSNYNFDGIMSYVAFIEGTQELPGIFGETDSTTGEWKIKIDITPSNGWGTNGYLILKNGNSVTDESSNSNNFTVGGGTLTKTEDSPSNVFATFNPLNVPTSDVPTFAAGNTDLDSCANASLFHGTSTLGMSAGKYYAEFKWKSNSYPLAGITSRPAYDAKNKQRPGQVEGSYGYYLYNGDVKTNNSTVGSFTGATLSIGDILCIAVDCDNNKLYFRKNGDAWLNSGDPTSGSTGTGAVSITPSTEEGDNWFFSIGDGDTSSSSKISANFGNGYFLTTAVSSAGTNASGNGIFEFDVPTGYTALSTKGLNT